MWFRFSYFLSISSSNGHFKFQRRGKIIKLCFNTSKGAYVSKIFLIAIDNSNWVDFWENNYLGPPKDFRDIQIQPLECIVQHAKTWCSIQVKCSPILCNIHPNGLVNTLKKNHHSMSTHLCFSFFWCSFEVICWIFLIEVHLGGWTKVACDITKNAHLCAFYHPWNPQRIFLDFMCPNV